MKYRKAYVEVAATFTPEGKILPVAMTWEDGCSYPVDRILAIEPRASLKAGGAGIRYTCMICGKEKHLFLEESRWFVEAKVLPRE